MLRKFIPAFVLAAALSGAAYAQDVEIRMATLAPRGSPWHKVLEKMGERWRQISGGKVKLTISPGGMLGDEPDLVRKMRIGLIQAVALSGAGMGEIEGAKGVAALQIPLMFDSYAELDYVRDRVAPRIEKEVEAKGNIILNWGDAGWVYFFSSQPVARLDDLRKLKLFTWEGSNDEVQLWKASGFHPVPLAATDIPMSLESGMIDAVPTTPLYCESSRCFAQAKYMCDVKWAPLVGATVISKKTWDKIPAGMHDALMKAARDSGAEMRDSIRTMGETAIKTMEAGQAGNRNQKLKVIHADDAARADWMKQTQVAYAFIRGGLVPADMFDEVKRLRDEFRAHK